MVEHVDLAPPTVSEIVLIGAREAPASAPSLDELVATVGLAQEAASDASASDAPDANVVEVADAADAADEGGGAVTQLPPPPEDPFTVLVCRLSDVAISAGAPHVAALLPALLFEGQLTTTSLDAEAAQALRDGGLLAANSNEVAPSFVSKTIAWREILRGTSDDFEAAGNVMLDEWAADVLARLLSTPARATTLRQELRTRGIAAFGLVEAA